MTDMFENLIDTLKKNPKKIVFTEVTDPRILEASARLLASRMRGSVPSVKTIFLGFFFRMSMRVWNICMAMGNASIK